MWSKFAVVGLLSVAALVLVLSSASAQCRGCFPPPRPPPPPAVRVSMTLEDGAGHPLRTFHHRGRTYVLGQYGERYAIRLHNRGPRRVEAVLSVDGRDAVSGAVADYTRQRGYLIPAHGSILVAGFRQSLDQVATFRFSDPEDSYSSRMGTPQHVGVIGVAAFSERVRRPRPLATPRKQARGSRSAPASREADRSGRRQNLGTRYGEGRYSRVVEVPFQRQHRTRPDRMVRTYYDDAEGLQARGIEVFPVRPTPPIYPEPHPFPESRFAPPPPAR